MLSRVADNLYWFGRYLQRAENTARLINVNAILMLDLPRRMTLGWGPLIEIVGAESTFREHYEEATEENVVRFLIADPRNPGSIQSSLYNAREILRMREILNGMLANATGQTIDRVAKDVDRDYIMEPDQAVNYGMIDRVISSRDLAPVAVKG